MAFGWKGFLKPTWAKLLLAIFLVALAGMAVPLFVGGAAMRCPGPSQHNCIYYEDLNTTDFAFQLFFASEFVVPKLQTFPIAAALCYLLSCALVHFLAPKPSSRAPPGPKKPNKK
jgi:hypothetical protein